MPIRQVKMVTGQNRKRVEASIRHLNALLSYNAKQPSGSYLLPSQVTALTTAVGVLEALLLTTKWV